MKTSVYNAAEASQEQSKLICRCTCTGNQCEKTMTDSHQTQNACVGILQCTRSRSEEQCLGTQGRGYEIDFSLIFIGLPLPFGRPCCCCGYLLKDAQLTCLSFFCFSLFSSNAGSLQFICFELHEASVPVEPAVPLATLRNLFSVSLERLLTVQDSSLELHKERVMWSHLSHLFRKLCAMEWGLLLWWTVRAPVCLILITCTCSTNKLVPLT